MQSTAWTCTCTCILPSNPLLLLPPSASAPPSPAFLPCLPPTSSHFPPRPTLLSYAVGAHNANHSSPSLPCLHLTSFPLSSPPSPQYPLQWLNSTPLHCCLPNALTFPLRSPSPSLPVWAGKQRAVRLGTGHRRCPAHHPLFRFPVSPLAPSPSPPSPPFPSQCGKQRAARLGTGHRRCPAHHPLSHFPVSPLSPTPLSPLPSVGSNEQYDFEQAMGAALHTKPFTFDPFLSANATAHMLALPFLHFHQIAIAGAASLENFRDQNPGITFMTLKEAMEKLGHEYVDVLKMDCEGCEEEFTMGLKRETEEFVERRRREGGALTEEEMEGKRRGRGDAKLVINGGNLLFGQLLVEFHA
ncbi:unnamed protein product [Closterium sp. Naga37s-1]|nr:unnamed protein product [Closterium sp. Naga37s-1]